MDPHPRPESVIDRLVEVTNAHDLEGLVGCFAPAYVNETPAHPARGFSGRDQVRRNWEQIFAAVPDVVATVRSSVVDDDAVWSEWTMSGTRADGSRHRMAGVIIFRVSGSEICSARFYLEPLDDGGAGVDEAIREATRT